MDSYETIRVAPIRTQGNLVLWYCTDQRLCWFTEEGVYVSEEW